MGAESCSCAEIPWVWIAIGVAGFFALVSLGANAYGIARFLKAKTLSLVVRDREYKSGGLRTPSFSIYLIPYP